ncbi:MAG: hypothetical protein CM15mP83_2490 [Flavobacteriaceae bacterium]|nr:MAG: hypothetical protein CM15mP83_2490 [Flavobacteriaceae bacterium]
MTLQETGTKVRVKENNLVGYVGKSYLEKDESMPLNLGSIVLIIFLFLVINWIRKKCLEKIQTLH